MRPAALLSVLALTGCTATLDRAVGRNVSVSPLLATDCRLQCEKMQMRLAAVVLTSTVGACVCEPLPAAASPAPASPAPASPPAASPQSSAAGPAAALALAVEEAEEEQRRAEAH